MTRLTFVLAPGQNHFFVELAEALCDELCRLGVEAETVTGAFPAAEEGRAFALIPPHEYFVLTGHRSPPTREQLRRTLFITAEQPRTVHFRQNVALAARAGGVFDISTRAVRAYRRLGIRAEHLQLGHTGSWDHFDSAAERAEDLIFMGAWTPRRGRVLAAGADDLAQLRGRYVFSDNSRPNPAGSPGFLTGDEKWAALSGARMLLNVHQGDEPYFEWHRALQAIHCGTVVLSESSTDSEPLAPGVHFQTAGAPQLGQAALELARDPDRAGRIAAEAYELIRDELPLSEAASKLATAADGVAAGGPGPTAGRGRLSSAGARLRLGAQQRLSRKPPEPERPPAPRRGETPVKLYPDAQKHLALALEADPGASFAYGLVADAELGILNPLPWVDGAAVHPPLLEREADTPATGTAQPPGRGVNAQRLVARRKR